MGRTFCWSSRTEEGIRRNSPIYHSNHDPSEVVKPGCYREISSYQANSEIFIVSHRKAHECFGVAVLLSCGVYNILPTSFITHLNNLNLCLAEGTFSLHCGLLRRLVTVSVFYCAIKALKSLPDLLYTSSGLISSLIGANRARRPHFYFCLCLKERRRLLCTFDPTIKTF